jgi:hypothetical protein
MAMIMLTIVEDGLTASVKGIRRIRRRAAWCDGYLEIRVACMYGYDGGGGGGGGGDVCGVVFRMGMFLFLFRRACTFADDAPAGSGR